MLTRDDTESEVVRRATSVILGIVIFYAITEGITITFRIANGTPSFLGEPQALWRGYILMINIIIAVIAILTVITAKRSMPKIEQFLRKLCHNNNYWLCIFATVLIVYTILFVACPDLLTIFDRFTHM